MLSFIKFLEEKYLSIGLNPEHEKHRETHAQHIHDILHSSYREAGGYGGHKSGSQEEYDAIMSDIRHPNHIIKTVVRGGKPTTAIVYKKHRGRKIIAVGTDNSDRGKADLKGILKDDRNLQRSWGEVSGALEHVTSKMGFPKVPASKATELTGKPTKEIDQYKYTRNIGGTERTKTIIGTPK